ncbi:hypothetical protein EVAR_82590_1 [Eumeta japonica]|uniref:Uncharacterized protein n=1 Tax=Eumeta variegata TaxID=151549 RepID=A0A4C1X491_EUMVA|nr:hypothetical protein EVAR_82590_1 [Eumeta japonica]
MEPMATEHGGQMHYISPTPISTTTTCLGRMMGFNYVFKMRNIDDILQRVVSIAILAVVHDVSLNFFDCFSSAHDELTARDALYPFVG